MNHDKYHCPKCKLLFDCNNHIPRILTSCSHSICSYCLTEQLHKTPKSISCPIDMIVYNEVDSINIFKENTNLIEELQEKLNIPYNHNYEISNDDIFFDNEKSIMNSDKFNDSMNSLNLNASILSSSHCYYKKSRNIRDSLKEKSCSICEKHTLPLNVICIDEKKKICSQCALNDEHADHQIITEDEFMNNIDNLIDLFQEVDNNQINYLNYNNINTKTTLDKIGNNIDNFIKMINKTKTDIINNINNQCEKIEKYLKKRKKEIFGKYQSTNFDISTLRESTLNWMQIVTNKLDQLNEIKVSDDLGCLKLLDNDPNKNIFNLIRNGKQLNGRYNFVKETFKIIGKLESFDKKGISILPNKNIIDRIIFDKVNYRDDIDMNKEQKDKSEDIEDNIEINLNIDELSKKNDNENEKKKNEEKDTNIKSSLFKIEENKELINSLHLTKFKFDFIDNTNEEKDENKSKISKREKTEKEENNNKSKENAFNNNDKKEDKKYKDIDDDNEIILNLNINEINSGNDKENEKSDKSKKITENNNEKNNISKMIDELTFNDDTLLLNPLSSNLNDTVYHKKVKNDYPKDLKNLKKKEKEKENSIAEYNNVQTEATPQVQIQPKSITTKKLDLLNLKNIKSIDQKKNNINNNINGSNSNLINYNTFNDNCSVENDKKSNISTNKDEIVINFNKRLSGYKKSVNIVNSDKKSFMKQNSGEKSPNPVFVSRSPGRMVSNSKLEGFYNFIPNEKTKRKIEQNNNLEKAIVNKQDFTTRKKYDKNSFNCNYNDENETNNEFISNLNERRTSFCISKNTKKIKNSNKENKMNNNLIKKINSSKFMGKTEIQKTETNYNNNLNNNPNKSISNLISSVILNNSSNSYENKTKKELQDIINNQMKNNIPNFSRINMNGYGMQYLCSYLHKNPGINYKEMKLLGCNLNDDDLFILTRTLLDHEIGLLVLNLSSNKITDDSATNILDLLKDCKSLKGLSLYNNMIGTILKEKLKEYAKLGRSNFENVQLYI